MMERANLGKFQASIGSTNVTDNEYLVNDDDMEDSDDLFSDNEPLLDAIYEGSLRGETDLDDIMVSSAHA